MRPINKHDVLDIIDMTKELGRESPVYSQYEQDETYVAITLEQMILDDHFIGFIVPSVGFMFGSLGAQWYSPRLDFYESLLYIRPEHRGGSLAYRLIRKVEQEAKAAGAHVFWAGASTQLEESKTLALYERLGFTRTSQGVRKDLQCVQDLNYLSEG